MFTASSFFNLHKNKQVILLSELLTALAEILFHLVRPHKKKTYHEQ